MNEDGIMRQGKGHGKSIVLLYRLSGGCSFDHRIAILTVDYLVTEAGFCSVLQ